MVCVCNQMDTSNFTFTIRTLIHNHYPRTHPISTKEIMKSIGQLHNTRYKKLRRKEMLSGERPAKNDYCWGVEDNSDRFSDRTFKSEESCLGHFTMKLCTFRLERRLQSKIWLPQIACNFKCSYCAIPRFQLNIHKKSKSLVGIQLPIISILLSG